MEDVCYPALGAGKWLVEKLKALFSNGGTEFPFKTRSTVPSNSGKTPAVNRRGWTSLRQQECTQILVPACAALKQPNNCPAQDHLKTEEIYLHQLVSVFPKMTTLQKH